jgi:hypothetical protein
MADHSQGTSLQQPPQRSIKLYLKGTLGVPASSYPIKGQAGDSTKEDEEQLTTKRKLVFIPPKRSTSQAISFVLSLFL